MKRKKILATAFALCLCFFFSAAKVDNKFICTEGATKEEKVTPLTRNLEISIVHYSLLNI